MTTDVKLNMIYLSFESSSQARNTLSPIILASAGLPRGPGPENVWSKITGPPPLHQLIGVPPLPGGKRKERKGKNNKDGR